MAAVADLAATRPGASPLTVASFSTAAGTADEAFGWLQCAVAVAAAGRRRPSSR